MRGLGLRLRGWAEGFGGWPEDFGAGGRLRAELKISGLRVRRRGLAEDFEGWAEDCAGRAEDLGAGLNVPGAGPNFYGPVQDISARPAFEDERVSAMRGSGGGSPQGRSPRFRVPNTPLTAGGNWHSA
ncbi:hypothetical protein GCM10018775_42750 [Streptomyces umbrinus]|nr:hypothetical protein GCM10018775_42750 [Streptomyces umbrinus]